MGEFLLLTWDLREGHWPLDEFILSTQSLSRQDKLPVDKQLMIEAEEMVLGKENKIEGKYDFSTK